MIIEMPTMKNEHMKVWDSVVPIVKVNEYLYRVYLLDEIGMPADYAELIELMQDLDETVTIEWFLNSPGGVLNTATMLLNGTVNCKAKLIGKLSGIVASAATMLTLGFDEVEIAPYIEFLVHAWSVSGQAGKANEIEAQNDFVKKETKRLFNEVYAGFLTPREITKVLKGTDIWLNENEVKERLEKRKKSITSLPSDKIK